MKVFMIGGTGLLGSQAAKELIDRGHEVMSVALPPLPEGAVLPPQMKIEYGNYLNMTDEEIEKYMTGCEGFVFAAGVDERVEGPAPIYDIFKKYNIDPIKRLLSIAKRCGVKHSAICGSYFAHFAKTRPELELTKWHPYHSQMTILMWLFLNCPTYSELSRGVNRYGCLWQNRLEILRKTYFIRRAARRW